MQLPLDPDERPLTPRQGVATLAAPGRAAVDTFGVHMELILLVAITAVAVAATRAARPLLVRMGVV